MIPSLSIKYFAFERNIVQLSVFLYIVVEEKKGKYFSFRPVNQIQMYVSEGHVYK